MLQTAHNACNSKDVDALKFQLVRHDIFYNGQNQQDSTECLLMLINIIDKGSMPDSSSTTSPMGASLSDLLFSFVLEKYIVCEVCGPRSPSFESSSVIIIIIVYIPLWQGGSSPWWDELYRVVALCMLWLLFFPFVLVGCGAGPRCIWCWLLLFLGCWCCWRIFHYCTL